MRSTDSTPNADPSPKASTSPPAKSLPERYICKPCNKTLPLSYKSTHEASKRHMRNAPITCTLCNVSYGKDCHEAHIIGKKHLANLDPGVAPGVSWDRPAKKKQLGNGVAPKRLGDGIDVIRLVPLKTAPAASPVLWRCGVCAASMAVGMRANHQNGKCVPAPLKTRGNPFRAQVNADKKAETKKKERKERIWGARERKGDRGRIWDSEDDYY